VLVATCVASLLWHAQLATLWRVVPAFASWPLALAPMLGAIAVAAIMFRLVRRWALAGDWNDRHRLALACGAVMTHSLVGGMILAKTTTDRVGVATLALVTIVALLLFGIRIRDRTQPQVDGATAELQVLERDSKS
jgi:hypothetical protein